MAVEQSTTRTRVRIGDRLHEVALERRGSRVVAHVDGREHRLSVHESQRGVYSLLPLDGGGRSVEVRVAAPVQPGGDYRVGVRSRTIVAGIEMPGRAQQRGERGETGAGRVLKAVMPGRIVRVLVSAGDKVRRGQGIVVIEAMKMENELSAPREGTVVRVLASAGDRVEAGAELAVIE